MATTPKSTPKMAVCRRICAIRGGQDFREFVCFYRVLRTMANRCGSINGGEGGIRTHVPELPDHPISSRRRYDHFGTSPFNQKIYVILMRVNLSRKRELKHFPH